MIKIKTVREFIRISENNLTIYLEIDHDKNVYNIYNNKMERFFCFGGYEYFTKTHENILELIRAAIDQVKKVYKLN